MYAKINIGDNFSLPSPGMYTCKAVLKSVKMIQIFTHYALMLQKKSMCPDEKAITQSGGKAFQPFLLRKEVNNYHFDVLGLFMPSYASNIFLRQTDEGLMKWN